MNWKRYRLTLVLAFVASLTVGCMAHSYLQPEPEKIKEPRLGIYFARDKNLEVENFYRTEGMTQSPAEKAGVKKGDIIKTIYGIKVNKQTDITRLIRTKSPGDVVPITVERQGQGLLLNIKLGFIYIKRQNYQFRPIEDTIIDILSEGKPVRLAVVVSEITNAAYRGAPEPLKQWEKSIEANLVSFHESGIMSTYGTAENFSLVDRHTVSQILEEHKLSMVGITSRATRYKLGEILGLTHLLIIDFARMQYNARWNLDIEVIRLIRVETGQVLQSAKVTQYNRRL